MLTYLATPYSHPDLAIRILRYDIVTRIAAQLMRQGEIIYSPISHTHVMAMQYGLPTDWNYWAENCMAFLNASRKLIVLQQDGWQESIGVQAEMSIARDKGLLIEMMAVD